MNGLVFEERGPVVRSAPNRADITCFVGFVGRRQTLMPAAVRQALAEQGWTSPPYARPIDELVGKLKPGGLFVDVKSRAECLRIGARGVRVWRL